MLPLVHSKPRCLSLCSTRLTIPSRSSSCLPRLLLRSLLPESLTLVAVPPSSRQQRRLRSRPLFSHSLPLVLLPLGSHTPLTADSRSPVAIFQESHDTLCLSREAARERRLRPSVYTCVCACECACVGREVGGRDSRSVARSPAPPLPLPLSLTSLPASLSLFPGSLRQRQQRRPA